jgi:AAA domain/Primase C terminal 2 (PriCT-2)
MNTDATRDFMSRVVPWPKSDEPGYINVHWHLPGGNFKGVAATTLDAFMHELEEARRYKENIYFCLSQQSKAKPNGGGKLTALRHSVDATALKSLFFDVDAGPGKPYANIKEVLAALKAFREATGLPPPSAIVASGSGGAHVYYISKTPLLPGLWQRHADALKALAFQHGLHIDGAVTGDSARVLRVPGTLNWKHNPPREVKLLGMGEEYDFATIEALKDVTPAPGSRRSYGSQKAPPPIPARYRGKPCTALIVVRDEDLPPSFPPMSAKDLRACLDRIPNDTVNWDRWNTIGMRIYAACEGEDYGLHEWQRWSDQLIPDGKDSCEDRWNTYHTSPPSRTGAGALVNEVRRITGYERWLPPKPGLRPAVDGAFDRGHPITIENSPAPIAWSAADLKVSFSNIPHRQWLYGTYLIRGEITVLAAPGGAGKTALATAMAVEVATNKELLGEKIWRDHDLNLKVLFVNAEDSGTEIRRRVWAFCRAHNVAEQDLGRLYVAGNDNTLVQRLSFLQTTDKKLSVLDQKGFTNLEAALQSLHPDVVILDPLVALCGGGDMNDNAAMSLVIRELKRLASNFNCAVLILHHTRKGGDVGNPEAISGAAAIVNLSRRAIMPVPMTQADADELKVLPSQRFRYFKVIDAKSNLAPRSDESPWYQLDSIELPNPEPPIYPFGDSVQAVARVTLPLVNNASVTADDQKIRRAILDLADRGKIIDGQSYPYSPNVTGAKNDRALLDDAIAAVADATAPKRWPPGDLRAVVKRAIETLKSDKWLVEGDKIKGPRFRRGNTVRVDWSRTPWSKERDADGQSTEASNDTRGEVVVNGQ